MSDHRIVVTINGQRYEDEVESRVHLADYLRYQRRLTGTHIGCEHGVCGACTVLVDGKSTRSCLVFAAQVDGCSIETIEGVSGPDGGLHSIQQALIDHHGLQCGYCTPGVVMTLLELQRELGDRSIDELGVRKALSGNLCRCTGYEGIVDAALSVLGCKANRKRATGHVS